MDLKDALQKYKRQTWSCAKKFDRNGNKVDMKLTFEEWCAIWKDSGKWGQRGHGKGFYVMERNGDVGHYEIGNVRICLFEENTRESRAGVGWVRRATPKVSGTKTKGWPCTIDGGKTVFPSMSALRNALGRGKDGSGSPNFTYRVS